jgi:coproporphyrinogen III oxidase
MPALAGPGLEPVPVASGSLSASASATTTAASSGQAFSEADGKNADELFEQFVEMLQQKQEEIINTLEQVDGSGQKFTNDTWGFFADGDGGSGGITRVIQGGDLIEKGAVSFTLVRRGVLSDARAAAIRQRQSIDEIRAGDTYATAALTTVQHARNPMVPTFRSDVRMFLVSTANGQSMAWFGGGADLTPNYLFEEDIVEFHEQYRALSERYLKDRVPGYSYESMKATCDTYFYLPARAEHRGTGGIFFDDMPANERTVRFVEGVANTWIPSWLPTVERRRNSEYTEQQRQWQLLRRGRYVEFNLLNDRGVKVGLARANPRVEAIMVSAPPLVAWEYNHEIEAGSAEAKLMEVLKNPRDWVR